MNPAKQSAAFQLGHGGRGILLIHGFCGSASQMRFLAEGLHAAGYTVRVPLLPGHGTNVKSMRESTFRDWLDHARYAYAGLREECTSVSVAGHSMGGVIALLLAEEYTVSAVAALAAPMHLSGARGLLAPFSALAAPFIPYVKWPGPRRYPEDFLLDDHISYDSMPVSKVRDLYCLMRRARLNLFAITAPLLTIQSGDDVTVSRSSPRIIAGGVSSSVRRHVRLTRSGHLIPLGPERGRTLSELIRFFDEYMQDQ